MISVLTIILNIWRHSDDWTRAHLWWFSHTGLDGVVVIVSSVKHQQHDVSQRGVSCWDRGLILPPEPVTGVTGAVRLPDQTDSNPE